MILTVTPNPSLDRTYEVPSLDRGEVVRATGERVDPGGKGVNVSRAVAAAGRRTVAVLPLGGAPGALVADLLDAQGIEVAPVPVAGATRSNIALAEADGVLTKINAPGPDLTPAEQENLLDTVRRHSAGADWIVCCGSLPAASAPPGTPNSSPASTPPASASPSTPRDPPCSPPSANTPTWSNPTPRNSPRPWAGPSPPSATPSRPPRTCARRAPAPSSPASAPPASSSSTTTALVRHRPRRRRPQQRRRRATPPLAGFLVAGGRGPEALASAVAHGAAAVRLPGSVMPSPTTSTPPP